MFSQVHYPSGTTVERLTRKTVTTVGRRVIGVAVIQQNLSVRLRDGLGGAHEEEQTAAIDPIGGHEHQREPRQPGIIENRRHGVLPVLAGGEALHGVPMPELPDTHPGPTRYQHDLLLLILII